MEAGTSRTRALSWRWSWGAPCPLFPPASLPAIPSFKAAARNPFPGCKACSGVAGVNKGSRKARDAAIRELAALTRSRRVTPELADVLKKGEPARA